MLKDAQSYLLRFFSLFFNTGNIDFCTVISLLQSSYFVARRMSIAWWRSEWNYCLVILEILSLHDLYPLAAPITYYPSIILITVPQYCGHLSFCLRLSVAESAALSDSQPVESSCARLGRCFRLSAWLAFNVSTYARFTLADSMPRLCPDAVGSANVNGFPTKHRLSGPRWEAIGRASRLASGVVWGQSGRRIGEAGIMHQLVKCCFVVICIRVQFRYIYLFVFQAMVINNVPPSPPPPPPPQWYMRAVLAGP